MSDTEPTPPSVSRGLPPGLIERAVNIILRPLPTWETIAGESASVKSIYMGYAAILAAIGPVCHAVGGMIFGRGVPGLMVLHTPPLAAVAEAVVGYVLNLVMVYVLALIIDALAPSFGGRKDRLSAFKVAAYSSTAAWVAGVFGLIPALAILGLLGFYSFYLLYLGLPRLMQAPADKGLGYTVVVIIVSILLWIIVAAVGGAIGGAAMMGLGGAALTQPEAQGRLTTPVGGVDLGKLQKAADQMSKQAEAMKNGTAAPVKVADPSALAALLPASYMGVSAIGPSTSSGGAGGVKVAAAETSYPVNGGTIRLKISDNGGLGGLGGVMAAADMNVSNSSAGGYDKLTTQNGEMVSEKYDANARHGEYAVIADGRYSITAEGDNVDMSALKSLVAGIDMNRLKALGG
ncbi:MAG TPA: Yip1 family protein [Asticcacaulis sp.]